jgi:hypothetical protein
MPRGVANLSKFAISSQGMTDERMPPVVNRQRFQAVAAEDLARAAEFARLRSGFHENRIAIHGAEEMAERIFGFNT